MIVDWVATMPSEAWGLFGAVIGSLFTVIGVSLTNRANLKQLVKRLDHEERITHGKAKKERLEELYILVCKWSHAFFGNFLHLSLVMKGQIDYNEYLDYINSSGVKGVDFDRIKMIIDIYAVELESSFSEIIKVREEINDIEALHKSSYLQGQSGSSFLQPASNAQLKLGKVCEEFKIKVSEAARTA